MRTHVIAIVGLLLLVSAAADAQTISRPPAPVVTAGAGMKEVIFDWDPVPGAQTYRLYANTGDRGYFVPVSDERIPRGRTRAAIPIAVHKQEWSKTRYLVTACNSAGCTRSNEVSPADLMLETIGYLKASNTGARDGLGAQVALSADGSTLAVSAGGEDGANNSLPQSGAVYIYRRNGRQWTQEAMLKASDGLSNTRLGSAGGSPLAYRYLGLSANGSTLAVGAPTRERSGLANAGVVFVYQRAADNSWSEVAQFAGAPVAANDYYGYSVDVSSDGAYIKVNSMYPQGGAGTPEGRTIVWHWNGQAWSASGAIAPYYAGDRCPTVRMTADAKLLVSACRTPAGDGRLVTSRRVIGTNTWLRVADQAYLWFENPNMAMNYDGSWIAFHEHNPYDDTGGIGIYRRNENAWVEHVHWLGASNSVGYNGFGHAIEFSRNGEHLAFSDPRWFASGAGSMESWGGSGFSDGAVLILKRQPDAIGHHHYTRLLKASNPGDLDRFGESVAFGGADGHYLAVGAPGEDSAATGVDGDQLSEVAESAGAVYLY